MAVDPVKKINATLPVDPATSEAMPAVKGSSELPSFTMGTYTPQVTNESLQNAVQNQQRQINIDELDFVDGWNFSGINMPANMDDESALDDFLYRYGKEKGLVGNVYTMLQAVMELPEYDARKGGFISGEELYGEDYQNLTYTEKLEKIRLSEEAQLAAKYPVAHQRYLEGKQGAAGGFGAFLGSIGLEALYPPLFVSSIGKSSLAAAIGAGTYSLTDDIVKGKDVDFGKAALIAGGGAVFNAAAFKGMEKLRGRQVEKNKKFVNDEANKIMDNAALATAYVVANDLPFSEIPEIVAKRFGHSRDDVNAAKGVTGRKVRVPKKAEAQTIITSAQDALNASTKKNAAGQLIEKYAVPVLNRLQEEMPFVANALNKMEMRRHTNLFVDLATDAEKKRIAKIQGKPIEEVQAGAGNFLKTLRKLNDAENKKLLVAARKGDVAGMEAIISRVAGTSSKQQLKEIRDVLDDVSRRVVGSVPEGTFKFTKMKNYFPTKVKDFDGLSRALGNDKRIGAAMVTAAKRDLAEALDVPVNDIPKEELSELLSKLATGHTTTLKDGKFNYVKTRKVDEVTEDLAQYYQTLDESIYDYITKGNDFSETMRFFNTGGKGFGNIVLKKNAADEAILDAIDMEASMTNFFVKNAPMASSKSINDASTILKARFGKGQESPNKILRHLRDLGYAWTLANPFSALVQLSDIGLSMWMNGFNNTFRAILSKKDFDMLEFGLADTVQAIATNPRDLSASLNNFMKVSGFQRLDRVGKNIYMNAAWRKLQAQAKEGNKEGLKKLRRKYAAAYGDEYESLLSDIRRGSTSSENVRLLIWNELSDAQPISLSKTPLASLENPDGRIFYGLKMFAINQLNLVGRETFKKIKHANPQIKKEGYKNLAMLLPTVAMVGASVDTIRDYVKNGFEGFDPEDFPANMGEYMLKMIGLSYYSIDQLNQGQFGKVATNYIGGFPAWSAFSDMFVGVADIANDGLQTDNTLLTNLPVVGDLAEVLLNDPGSAIRADQYKFKPPTN
jgi:hypothetical protein